jgi:IS5 family transposase
MSEQRKLASVADDTKGKVTRRKQFPREMGSVIPWGDRLALIVPHHPVAGNRRRPLPLGTMLRVYFL